MLTFAYEDDAFDEHGKLLDPTLVNTRPYPHILTGSCSAGTVICCNTRKFCQVSNPIPGFSMPDKWIDRAELIGLVEDAVRAARAHALTICMQKKCECSAISIKVNCDPDALCKPGLFFGVGSKHCSARMAAAPVYSGTASVFRADNQYVAFGTAVGWCSFSRTPDSKNQTSSSR